jgi:hypothetical protein
MSKRLMGAMTVVVALSMLVGWKLAGTRIEGRVSSYSAPRDAYGHPNLSGIWQTLNSANWDIEPHSAQAGPPQFGTLLSAPAGLGVVDGGAVPYTPQALLKKKQNASRRWTDDPEAKCYLPGVPRFTYLPFPFQIHQGSDAITMASEYAGANRTIHLKALEPAPVDTWMGQSAGRFEGDTLVVEVTSLNGQSWLDRAGNFASENARITERFTPTAPDRLTYEASIEDPTIYTGPWTMRMPLYRRGEANAQLVEFRCVEFAEEFLYGNLRKPTKQ